MADFIASVVAGDVPPPPKVPRLGLSSGPSAELDGVSMGDPDSPEALGRLLQEQGVAKTIRQFRRRPLSSDLLRESWTHATASDGLPVPAAALLREFIATYPLSPSDLLEQMLEEAGDDVDLLAALAAHPRTAPGNLALLLKNPKPTVRAAASANPQLSPRQLAELAGDRDELVALAAVAHPGLKARHQAILAMSRHAGVRAALAQSPRLEEEIAIALTADPSPLVRLALGSGATVSEAVLTFWADSDDLELQLGLLQRQELPGAVLHSLLLSRHGEVRQAAAADTELSLPYLVLLIEQGDATDHQHLAARPDLPPPLFETLASIGSPETLARLARNPALPAELADRLAAHSDALHWAVLENPTHRARRIAEMMASADDDLLGQLAYLPEVDTAQHTPLINDAQAAGLLAHLAAQGRTVPGLRTDLAFSLLQHPMPSLRLLALRSHDFPPGSLAKLLADPSPAVNKLARQQMGRVTAPTPNNSTTANANPAATTATKAGAPSTPTAKVGALPKQPPGIGNQPGFTAGPGVPATPTRDAGRMFIEGPGLQTLLTRLNTYLTPEIP